MRASDAHTQQKLCVCITQTHSRSYASRLPGAAAITLSLLHKALNLVALEVTAAPALVWSLHELHFGGHVYLHDRSDQRVYTPGQPPSPVGLLDPSSGSVVFARATTAVEVLETLGHAAHADAGRLLAAFNAVRALSAQCDWRGRASEPFWRERDTH
jgi:hypothetical protein